MTILLISGAFALVYVTFTSYCLWVTHKRVTSHDKALNRLFQLAQSTRKRQSLSDSRVFQLENQNRQPPPAFDSSIPEWCRRQGG